jgi:hypothetical protein
MLVDSFVSIEDLWTSTSSRALINGVCLSLCLSLEYLIDPRPCSRCWNHYTSVRSRRVFGSSIEYHFQGRIQSSCSIHLPSGWRRNPFASEKTSNTLRHVSHQDFGGLCWFRHRILVSIGSLNPSYAAWVILLPLNVVMSDGEMIWRKILHALICR